MLRNPRSEGDGPAHGPPKIFGQLDPVVRDCTGQRVSGLGLFRVWGLAPAV